MRSARAAAIPRVHLRLLPMALVVLPDFFVTRLVLVLLALEHGLLLYRRIPGP